MRIVLNKDRIVPLLATRERRPNAGNRMAAMLEDEDYFNEIFTEEAGDVEFIAPQKEERDIFDSDFTSSGSDNDEIDEERQLAESERAAKKLARAKKAHVNPLHRPSQQSRAPRQDEDSPAPRPSKRRKLSPGGTTFVGGVGPGERTSTRTAAVNYKQSVDERLEAEEARRVALTSRQRSRKASTKKKPSLTQAELINEALETEEANRASLRAFYAAEAEKKETQTVSGRQRHILGPTVTYISRVGPQIRRVHLSTEAVKLAPMRNFPTMSTLTGVGADPDAQLSGSMHPDITSASLPPVLPTVPVTAMALPELHSVRPDTQASIAPADPSPPLLAITAPVDPVTATEPCTRSVLGLRDMDLAREHVLAAIFGYHADWTHLHIIPHKNRALHKKAASCFITGQPARYRDPLTGCTYADAPAFRQLRLVAHNAFRWNDGLNTFV